MRELPQGITEEQLATYRKMTPDERLSLTLQMTSDYTAWLRSQPPEVAEQFFAELRRDRELSRESLIRGLYGSQPLHREE